jgi:hypothetical protein
MAKYKIEKKRFIFNADFTSVVDFFQNQYEIIKDLQTEFLDWEVSGVEFNLQDKDNNISATFTTKKIIFECDEANKKIELRAGRDFLDTQIRFISDKLPAHITASF